MALLSTDIDERTACLVKLIKTDYFALTGKELRISDNSLIVEIWGHVYAGYFMLAMKKLFRTQLTDYLAKIVLKRCEIIDCGEKEIDRNRRIWDMFALGKNLIKKLLPRIRRSD